MNERIGRPVVSETVTEVEAAPIPGEHPGATHVGIPEQIRRLAELKDAGILTEEEFTAKKTDLLKRL